MYESATGDSDWTAPSCGDGVTSVDCGVSVACANISSLSKRPKLIGTSSCDHSYVHLTGIPGDDWDVCTLD